MAKSSGRAELDELGLGTGDKGVQKCVIVCLRWRLLEANWCFSDFVCDTSAFTTSVPKLRVLLQSVHCVSNSLSGTAFNQINSGCSSQHLTHLNLHFPRVVADSSAEVFPELLKCAVINSDQVVGKMPLTFLVTSQRSATHRTVNLTKNPKQNKKR